MYIYPTKENYGWALWALQGPATLVGPPRPGLRISAPGPHQWANGTVHKYYRQAQVVLKIRALANLYTSISLPTK